MEEKEKIDPEKVMWDMQLVLVDVYKEFNLESLRGAKDDYTVNGKQILVWHHDVTWKCALKYKNDFNYLINNDELVSCSEKLMHFTGLLFYHRPYINNPIKDAWHTGTGIIYPYYQNLADLRYNTYADSASEAAYAYWDRIGDLVATFFPDAINPRDVDFARAIGIIPGEFQTHASYVWLKNFKENEYKDFNDGRRRVVHYLTTNIKHRWEHIRHGSSDKEAMQKFHDERLAIADFYKKHLFLALDGYWHTMNLLEHISNILFADVDVHAVPSPA